MALLSKPRIQWLPCFLIASVSLQVFAFLLAIANWGAVSELRRKEVPSLVQLDSGRAIAVAPLGRRERTPAVVQRFATDSMAMLLTMSDRLPASGPGEAGRRADPGVPIETEDGRRRVTTAAWEASFALSADFRQTFLQRIAALTPPEVFDGELQAVLVPVRVGAPQRIRDGEWKVALVANSIVVRRGDRGGEAIPFNKEIFVRAIDAPPPPEATSPLAQQVHAIRAAGLEIYAIRDLERPDL
jgi:hypothetical protein